MAGLFKDSQALKSLDLSKFDTQNVEDMSSMFENCYSLTSIKFPGGLVTKKVKKMNSMFNNCIILKKIDLSSFRTDDVDDMSSMFKNCKALMTININSFDTSHVVNMSYMFDSCSALKSVTVSDDIKFDSVSANHAVRNNRRYRRGGDWGIRMDIINRLNSSARNVDVSTSGVGCASHGFAVYVA